MQPGRNDCGQTSRWLEVEALLVSICHIMYLCGFTGSAGVLLFGAAGALPS